ncbi:MAG: class I SAM-dependent methyltransferase [Potamolinea sp.]
MSEIKNVSGTAFIIAEFRAEENAETAPLYQDEIVKFFLNEQTKHLAEEVAKTFPLSKEMVKIRTKYFDDVLSQQLDLGVQQVVILGSGLDTRAIRKQAEGVTYFEIDAQATLQLKEESLKQNNITANVRYIPGDYVKDDLISLLKQHNFDFNLPTYILWEGNITYLSLEAVRFVLKQICDYVKSFKLSLDYMSEKVIAKTTGYQEMNDYIEKLEKMGAPWLIGFDNIATLCRGLELKVLEKFSTAELYKKYRPNRVLESNLFKFYFLCTLERF